MSRYTVEYLPYLPEGEKRAYNAESYREVRDVMKRIYEEDPSYWPYGLDIPGHQDVYAIRDNQTEKIAGFVGWQEFTRGGKKVGSYSIGILPEYRGKGFAKEAVAKVLLQKAAGVDSVCAYVMSHNTPSKHLAATLHIPVQEKF